MGCWPNNPFWDFSIELYSRNGVAERLLLLQEKLRVDINFILYCYWAGYIGAPYLTESDVNNALELITAWQKDVVQPLRTLRSTLKNNAIIKPNINSDKVREKIKLAELEAERFEQFILYQEYSLTGNQELEISEKISRAKENVVLYFNCLKIKPNSKYLVLSDEVIYSLFN